MAKLRNLTASRPEASIHTRRTTAIARAVVFYVDGTKEKFIADEHGRFKLTSIVCGEVRRAGGMR